MRSEPDSWSTRVITASKPCARTASATLCVSVATTTRPRPLSAARSRHMHDHRAAGDVGQRLARQAGRGHAGRDQDERGHGVWRIGPKGVESVKRSHWQRPYRCCNGQAKDLVSARFDRPGAGEITMPTDGWTDAACRTREPGAYGLVRIQQGDRRTCWAPSSSCSRSASSRMRSSPRRRRKSPASSSRRPRRRTPARGAAAAEAAKPIAELLASADAGAGRGRLQEVRGLPHRRKGRPQQGRPESLGHRRTVRSPRMRASPIRPA